MSARASEGTARDAAGTASDAFDGIDARVDFFLGTLPRDEFGIGVGERVAVATVLATLRAEGRLGDPAALVEWVAPIVCRSPAEQTRFRERFGAMFRSAATSAPAQRPSGPPPEEVAVARQWAWWVVGAIALVVGVLALWIWLRPPPKTQPLRIGSTGPTPVVGSVVAPRVGTTTAAPAGVLVDDWSRGFGDVTLIGHTGPVNTVFAFDGKRVVTASDDGTARLWDLDGHELAVFRGHTDRVVGACFSPDGKSVLTASDDKTARLWDLTGREVVAFKGHTGAVNSAVFSHDGKRVLTASQDSTARIWDAAVAGPAVVTLTGHQGEVVEAAFAPQDRYVVTASSDKTARVWDTTGRETATLRDHYKSVTGVLVSPDASRILTTGLDGNARLWDTSGRPIAVLQGADGASFSQDGSQIVTFVEEGTVRVWDRSDRQIATWHAHDDAVVSAVFAPDGDRILTACEDDTARIWDPSGKEREVLRGHTGDLRSAVFSPDGSLVLTASVDGTARLWSVDVHEPTVHRRLGGDVRSAVFSADGSRVLTAQGNAPQLWDLEGSETNTFSRNEGATLRAAFLPDGSQVVSASDDKTARLWDLELHGYRETQSFREHTDVVYSVAPSPDGKRIVTASADRTARIWDLSGGQSVVLQGHEGGVRGACFSPDGSRVLTASSDRTARLWNPADTSGGALVVFRGHRGALVSASFSPDGQRVLTASDDGTTRLWDLIGRQTGEIWNARDPLANAVFSQDGSRVLTAARDGRVIVWEERDGTWKAIDFIPGGHALSDAQFDPTGTRVVTAGTDGNARIWTLAPSTTSAPLWPWLLGAASLSLAAAVAFRALFGQIALRRRRSGPGAKLVHLPFQNRPDPVRDTIQLEAQAGRLRARAPVAEGTEIDPVRTIARTVELGGLPQVVYERVRRTTTYLALVERLSPRDILAAHVERRIRQLSDAQVQVETGSFSGDASVISVADPRRRLVRPDELHARHRGRRLWLAGDYRPGTADSRELPWVGAVSAWSHRTVLVPQTKDLPASAGTRLRDEGVLLADAAAPADPVNDAARRRPKSEAAPAPFPPSIAFDPDRWTSPTPPDPARVASMLVELERHLGEDGWLWFRACAVYPELHYELTRDLAGVVLATEFVDEDAFVRLARLPWFRRGVMPEWLRTALLDGIPPRVERAVREYFLAGFASDVKSRALGLAVAVDAKGPLRATWQALTSRAAAETKVPKDKRKVPAALRDAVFVDWMDDSILSLRLPRRVLRRLRERSAASAPSAPRRYLAGIAWGVLAGAAIGWSTTALPRLEFAAAILWVWALLAGAAAAGTAGRPRWRQYVGGCLEAFLVAEAFYFAWVTAPWARHTFGDEAVPGFLGVACSYVLSLVGTWWTRRPGHERGLLARLADVLLPDRIVSWLRRDFSDGQAPDAPGEPRPRGLALLATCGAAATITTAAWKSEATGRPNEWVWAIAGLVLVAVLAAAVLAESRSFRPEGPKSVAAEVFVAGVAVLGTSAALSGQTIGWLSGLVAALVVALLAQTAVATIHSLRRRRHPLYELIVPLESAAAVVSVDALLGRVSPGLAERTQAAADEGVRAVRGRRQSPQTAGTESQ